ncbi:MAG: integron integrase [Chloroflexota bacterium]|nr:integron integrase [Chloroflexota bacterium]
MSSVQQKPKLLDQVRHAIQRKNYAMRTEETYTQWIKRFILYHNKRHPKDMAAQEIEDFLTYLAVEQKVSASTQNQAASAILFLYREVLKQDPGLVDAFRPKRPKHLPTVLTKEEVLQVLSCLSGINLLMSQILYGAGMRIMECVRLRVKDVDFQQRQIIVRDGKGHKDRLTMLPETIIPDLEAHLKVTKAIHEKDLLQGYGTVYLPYALARKYPNANRDWIWQYVFPSSKLSRDPRTGVIRRHHIDESGLRKAIKRAAHKAVINKHVTPHTFRHSFATHLLEAGYDIRIVQELLGHKNVKTTMIYTHVLNRGPKAVRSPLDST